MEELRKVAIKENGVTKYNFFNTDTNNYISEQWFDWCSDFNEGMVFTELDGLAFVELNKKYNLINTNSQLLSNQWFDYIYDFVYDIARVRLDGKYNFINKKGKLISKEWFDDASNFYREYARIRSSDIYHRYGFINKNGKLDYDNIYW